MSAAGGLGKGCFVKASHSLMRIWFDHRSHSLLFILFGRRLVRHRHRLFRLRRIYGSHRLGLVIAGPGFGVPCFTIPAFWF